MKAKKPSDGLIERSELNHKHLYYFWIAAKVGGVAQAAIRLNIAPQTISGQIRVLEETLGVTLFDKPGRKLELTDTGRLVMSYADEIFGLTLELEEMLARGPAACTKLFRVGISDVVPKNLAYRLVEPGLDKEGSQKTLCREGKLTELVMQLVANKLDLVIADAPMPSIAGAQGFNHLLGQSGITFFAAKTLASKCRNDFPRCLDGAPVLLPSAEMPTHERLMRWFCDRRLRPNIVGEFDDSALMNAFGQAGIGVFPAPRVIMSQIMDQHAVSAIGHAADVVEHYYAITVQRRLTHPTVIAIAQHARSDLFQDPPTASGREEERV